MESVNKTNKSNGFKLSVLTLAIMNITAVVSLRGLATEAIYGLQSAFYYLFAAVVFGITAFVILFIVLADNGVKPFSSLQTFISNSILNKNSSALGGK